MAIPAASGYPQYSNSLITPIFRMDLLERFYDTTIYSDISTTEYTGDLNKGGDQITFMREPKVIVRDYTKNGKIIHDTVDASPVTMTVDHSKTFSIKMNMIDEKQIQNFDRWKAAFLKNAGIELARQIDPELLADMVTEVADYNQGSTAGLTSKGVDLGETGSPLAITSSNIIPMLSNLQQVLDEALAPREGRFVVLPPVALNALRNSELRLAYATALNSTPMINGKLPNEIAGFTVIESRNIPTAVEGGKTAYHIVAGVPMATAFAAQIENSRVLSDKDDWANYYQGLSVYGFKVLYPDALATAYATITAA